MPDFKSQKFDEKIVKAYRYLINQDVSITAGNDPQALGQALSNLEQDLKQSPHTKPEDIDKVSFDHYQKLVTRIGWLSSAPKKYESSDEIFILNRYFEDWLSDVYEVYGVAYDN